MEKSKRQRILEMMEDRLWHNYLELSEAFGQSTSYSPRLRELRRLGYDIESRPYGKGKEYRLVGRKRPEQRQVKAYMHYDDVKEALESGRLNSNLREYLAEQLRIYDANTAKGHV